MKQLRGLRYAVQTSTCDIEHRFQTHQLVLKCSLSERIMNDMYPKEYLFSSNAHDYGSGYT
jgi:hypothetical protein